MTRHCQRCGREWSEHRPPGRTEACPQCGSDLHACRNCARHDVRAAHECREPRAEPVPDKEGANFCEWFEFAVRAFVAKPGPDRAEAARASLRKLLGD